MSVPSYKFILRPELWNIYLWRISCGACHSTASGSGEAKFCSEPPSREAISCCGRAKGSCSSVAHFTHEENESRSGRVASKRNTVSYKRCVPQISQGGNLSLLPSPGCRQSLFRASPEDWGSCHLYSMPAPRTGVQTMAALKLRIKVKRDSLRMCHRTSFAKVTRRGCSALGQLSGTWRWN